VREPGSSSGPRFSPPSDRFLQSANVVRRVSRGLEKVVAQLPGSWWTIKKKKKTYFNTFSRNTETFGPEVRGSHNSRHAGNNVSSEYTFSRRKMGDGHF
jgi:hypothetical protein